MLYFVMSLRILLLYLRVLNLGNMNADMFDLANRFMRTRFIGKREVLGVLLRGSSVIGVRDKFADLDFDLIVPMASLREMESVADETTFEGIEVCWDYKSMEMLDAELRDWLRDTDLWAYATGKIMYDPTGKVKELLDRYKQYPESVRQEKMFSYFFYATGASPYNSEKAILRKDYVTAQMFLTNAVELYTSLLYLINRSFIPYRKWRINQLDKLLRKPDNYVKKISKVLFDEKPPSKETLTAKQAIVMQIMEETRLMLLQEGMDSRKIADDLWRFEPKYIPSI